MLNSHVLGCSHGCRYPCYAFSMAKSYGRVKTVEEWCRPRLVENALDLLDREIPRLKPKIRTVHLCFSTDPFMFGYPEIGHLSLAIIGKLNANGIPCSVLTKGLLPRELADERCFLRANDHGISLVSLNEGFRRRWEPGSAPYAERVAALRFLHEQGCRTWVHAEPYPTPNIIRQDIRPVLEAVSFAGDISFEGWNYNPLVRQYPGWKDFYEEQARIVERFLRERKK